MCGKLTPKQTTWLAANTTAQFVPLTRWLSAGELQAAMCLFELRCRSGNFQVRAAYQLADDDREAPDAPTLTGLTLSANGIWRTDLLDLTTAMASHTWVRFGLVANTSSGVGSGEVALTAAYRC
jgi:hypothetical protein